MHPGEGKTFNSTNLAAIIAKANKKVVIIDLDMHKPKVHKTFGMENKLGMSTYLTGKTGYREAIKQSDVVPNLWVLPSGPVPPNPSELIISKKMDDIIDELRADYDYIIIDTPPILLISDALVLRKYADSGIFVMNTANTTKQGLSFLQEIIDSNKLLHSSILLNSIKHKKWKYYYGK